MKLAGSRWATLPKEARGALRLAEAHARAWQEGVLVSKPRATEPNRRVGWGLRAARQESCWASQAAGGTVAVASRRAAAELG
ncbi:MAG: hypothetical protein DRN99_09435 [Thermoproteota archaeon]|nr:MAG: hypothetical protein DRN99_09435 [Candidatus Korarchaeota archaeon]